MRQGGRVVVLLVMSTSTVTVTVGCWVWETGGGWREGDRGEEEGGGRPAYLASRISGRSLRKPQKLRWWPSVW